MTDQEIAEWIAVLRGTGSATDARSADMIEALAKKAS